MISEKWNEVRALIFTVFSISTTIEAYVYSIAYIASNWVSVPRTLIALLSVWPPLWLLIGGAIMGPISDAIGRRRSLYLSLIMYVVGSLSLILSINYAFLLFSIAILMLAVGGEYNTVMISSHEYFPSSVRSRAVYLILNFTNFGGALAAALALANITSVTLQKLALGLTILVIIPVLYLLRSLIPESPYWLRARRPIAEDQGLNLEEGNRTSIRLPPLPVRVVIGGLIGWSYTAGFTLMVLTFGPYYFPSLTNWLIFAFSAASFISGIPVSMFADRTSRKLLLLISSLGSLVTSVLILSLISGLVNDQYIFWVLFILFSILVNMYFLTEDTLKSEYWITRRRGSYTAAVRVMSLGGSIPVIFLSSYLPVSLYLALAVTIFGVGFVASLVWYLIGVETGKGISISAWEHEK
ncbi:MFS transporter [Vulcanisaeta sp. JCM 16161]|uniref:MFS transporter n=1 Tax=Vulcanisaeta sp. JCM 16161 TaxID=1295372 RepID=UPI00406D3EF5